jgi:hypothetical protein
VIHRTPVTTRLNGLGLVAGGTPALLMLGRIISSSAARRQHPRSACYDDPPMDIAWWKITVAAVFAVLVVVDVLLGVVVNVGSVTGKIVQWTRHRRAKQSLRQFARGRWISEHRTNALVIANGLRWMWTSTHEGVWAGSGHGEIRDDLLVLKGERVGTTGPGRRPEPPGVMTIELRREGKRLEGPLTSPSGNTWDMKFYRDESARAEW